MEYFIIRDIRISVMKFYRKIKYSIHVALIDIRKTEYFKEGNRVIFNKNFMGCFFVRKLSVIKLLKYSYVKCFMLTRLRNQKSLIWTKIQSDLLFLLVSYILNWYFFIWSTCDIKLRKTSISETCCYSLQKDAHAKKARIATEEKKWHVFVNVKQRKICSKTNIVCETSFSGGGNAAEEGF